jgi:hypothetical protein
MKRSVEQKFLDLARNSLSADFLKADDKIILHQNNLTIRNILNSV